MKRYGYFVRLGGDTEIAEALARGAQGALQPFPGHSSEAVRRVAMMQHTPEEWARMTRRARRKYRHNPQPAGVGRALLVGYALACMGVNSLWRRLMGALGM